MPSTLYRRLRGMHPFLSFASGSAIVDVRFHECRRRHGFGAPVPPPSAWGHAKIVHLDRLSHIGLHKVKRDMPSYAACRRRVLRKMTDFMCLIRLFPLYAFPVDVNDEDHSLNHPNKLPSKIPLPQHHLVHIHALPKPPPFLPNLHIIPTHHPLLHLPILRERPMFDPVAAFPAQRIMSIAVFIPELHRDLVLMVCEQLFP